MTDKASLAKEISESVRRGESENASALVLHAAESGMSAEDILSALTDGMAKVGEKFAKNEIFVPEVLLCSRAMKAGMTALSPYLSDFEKKGAGTVVIGTVKGDFNDIGKNLVKIMLEGKGLCVKDLGTDVSAADFVFAAKQSGARVICCSAVLSPAASEIKEIVSLCKKEGIRDKVRILTGGAYMPEALFCETGADAYTADAAECAAKALAFCMEKTK